MYKQNTASNKCSDQISTDSDGLIGSYGIADRDPKRGDINFLSDHSPHLPSPFLHHFFLDPRLWIPRCWPSIWRDIGQEKDDFICRFYPMNSDCSGGHCPKSRNFSPADSRIFWGRCQQLGMKLGILPITGFFGVAELSFIPRPQFRGLPSIASMPSPFESSILRVTHLVKRGIADPCHSYRVPDFRRHGDIPLSALDSMGSTRNGDTLAISGIGQMDSLGEGQSLVWVL
ncbi:hypothetical protein DFH07DRAFT_774511 [Mycena maculata]|uniref:Uncharacterized protein n=1 Tax=Mycena maculata TaxID=230809 RepID=A0AAD7IY72_9AGAR|nr:hypothetical protein DFH07DRAFT_774511 [Mycena maculata]